MPPLLAATLAHYPLRTRRDARRERFQGLNHLVPAVVLIQGAAEAFRHREASGLRGLELTVGAVFIALLLRHWFRVRYRPDRAASHGPEWLELAAAGILGLEGYHLYHRTPLTLGLHKFHVLPWLYGAVAVWYVLMAFHLARPASRRGLHFTPDGFWLRRWAWGRAHRVRWATLRALAPVGDGPDLLLYSHDEQEPQRLALHQYLNGPDLLAHLLAQAALHGVELAEPHKPHGEESSTRE